MQCFSGGMLRKQLHLFVLVQINLSPSTFNEILLFMEISVVPLSRYVRRSAGPGYLVQIIWSGFSGPCYLVQVIWSGLSSPSYLVRVIKL